MSSGLGSRTENSLQAMQDGEQGNLGVLSRSLARRRESYLIYSVWPSCSVPTQACYKAGFNKCVWNNYRWRHTQGAVIRLRCRVLKVSSRHPVCTSPCIWNSPLTPWWPLAYLQPVPPLFCSPSRNLRKPKPGAPEESGEDAFRVRLSITYCLLLSLSFVRVTQSWNLIMEPGL